MKVKDIVTVSVNRTLLERELVARYATYKPHVAESISGHLQEFADWFEKEAIYDAYDKLFDEFEYEEFLEECHHEEWEEARRKDEECFETLMFPACEKCKKVDTWHNYYTICTKWCKLQCADEDEAERWVNSERYKETLAKIEELSK